MLIKKSISLVLLFIFTVFIASPLAVAEPSSPDISLAEFLKTTDEIKAGYAYPSIKLTSAGVGKAVLKAHTPIVIRCTETISTKDIVNGGTVYFAVVADVKNSNGTTLIKAGTPVTAQISFSKNNGMIGRSGELTVSNFHTTAVDGSHVPLSGTLSSSPDDKMTLSIALSVIICPLFLLLKGDEARLHAGATKTAYTIVDTYIKTTSL